MADKRFRGRDKIVQKMTKDGLVEENLRTGETKSAVAEEPPKQEDSEKDAAESAEETPVVEEDVCMDAEDGEEEKPRRSTAKQSTEYYKAHQEDGKAKEKDASPVDEDAEPAPKKKGRLSFDDEQRAASSGARGWALRKWRRKEWIPPLVLSITRCIRSKKKTPAWSRRTRAKKRWRGCTDSPKARKRPERNPQELRKRSLRKRNPAV